MFMNRNDEFELGLPTSRTHCFNRGFSGWSVALASSEEGPNTHSILLASKVRVNISAESTDTGLETHFVFIVLLLSFP